MLRPGFELSNQVTAYQRLRPRGHWDRPIYPLLGLLCKCTSHFTVRLRRSSDAENLQLIWDGVNSGSEKCWRSYGNAYDGIW
jgi:hypothetical protein